jgi:hypothetical protein
MAIMSTRTEDLLFITAIVFSVAFLGNLLLAVFFGCWHACRATDAAIRAELYPHLSA